MTINGLDCTFIEMLEMSVFYGEQYTYTNMIDDGEGARLAQIARDYAKNLTDKQVEELNEYIDE